MKKRILFVDDEPLVLQGLQRMLHGMRQEWEMAFSESGSKALELMAQTPFDVVISDMRMPGMNGAELLAEVLKHYPKTVRLILSGHADRELVLKCIGSTHQCLSKPCRPEELKSAIARAGNLEQSLRDESLRHLISRMDRLPSMPALYVQIVEKLKDPDIDVEEIGDIVALDLAMTAKMLKLVNSAFFGLGRQISSPAEAVSYLGMETIKALVLSIHAFSQFSSTDLGAFSLEELWGHSQTTAGLAREIARMEEGDRNLLDEAFGAGLLHDIGKLVLASNFPKEYDQVLRSGQAGSLALLTAEEHTFGANHAEIGGFLLGLWGLPVPVVEAIALHHQPGSSPHPTFSALTAVHVATALVNLQQAQQSHNCPEELDLNYLEKLGLKDRLELWRDLAISLQPTKS
jgi:HD-like signal output (HDOD) protein/CheY-like chemotaxis protein